MERFWRNVQLNWWSRSNQFLTFWLALIIGAILAQYITISLPTLGWIIVIWFIVYCSGQDRRIELLSLLFVGVASGISLWELTNGESWLHIVLLSKVSDLLVGVRDRLVDKVLAALPEPQASLLAGILLGNRVKLDRELINVFRVVGLSHIIAVSGYNLTVLISNVRTIFRPVFGRNVFWFCLAVIIGFVIITGAPASILRAGLMVGLALWAQYLGRPYQPLRIVVLTAGFLVFFEPKLLFDIGFQLSLAATYGLLRLGPIISSQLEKYNWRKEIAGVVSETLAAFVMTAPLLLVVFERLSVISPLTNLLVVPLIPLLMTIGLLGLLLSFVLPSIGAGLLNLAWPILTWIVYVAHKASSLPLSNLHFSLSPWLAAGILGTMVIAVEYVVIVKTPSDE